MSGFGKSAKRAKRNTQQNKRQEEQGRARFLTSYLNLSFKIRSFMMDYQTNSDKGASVKKALRDKRKKQAIDYHKAGHDVSKIALLMGMSERTITRYLALGVD